MAALVTRPLAGRVTIRSASHRQRVRTHAAVLLDGVLITRCGFLRPAGEPRYLWTRSALVPISCRVCEVKR